MSRLKEASETSAEEAQKLRSQLEVMEEVKVKLKDMEQVSKERADLITQLQGQWHYRNLELL